MKRACNFSGGSAILYIVATPIGNMQEMTPRAIDILQNVALIGCEDTRNSKKLLDYFHIKNHLVSCHEHNEAEASEILIAKLHEGYDVAYVSDAGYPGLSDPGHRLILKALENDLKVSVISGANAMLNALIGSGLNTDHFYFHGFLPSKSSARIKELETLKSKTETLIFYESPHRIKDTLQDLRNVLGNRKACIARELTKKFEEFIRDDLESLLTLDVETLKGEMVVVIDGTKEIVDCLDDSEIIKTITTFTTQGLSTKDAIKKASVLLNINKNYLYKLVIENKSLN